MVYRGRNQPLPHPFVKWAGGKRSLAVEILGRLPPRIDTYVEPFLGGGAIFLALARENRMKRAVLGDRNPDLVQTWQVVKDDPEGLIAAIEAIGPAAEDTFYALRAEPPAEPVKAAARLIWLNRTCYNGLYRLNRSGGFNVPYGHYARPRLVNAENLRACSAALRACDAQLVNADFEPLIETARGADDVVYCDPPYLPLSATSNFSAYDGVPFGMDDHVRLADAFAGLRGLGVTGLLSNADTPAARALYAERELPMEQVDVHRSISRVAATRGKVGELLVSAAVAPAIAPRVARTPRKRAPAG